ncbi:ABC transporter transmembrane domain-containing protein, partial [Laceyella putida]
MSTFKQILRAVHFSFSLVWQHNRPYLFLAAGIRIILGFLPLLHVWLTQELINSAVHFIQTKAAFSNVIILLLLQIFVMFIQYAIGIWTEVIDRKMDNIVGMVCKERVLARVNELSYLTFENPEFYNMFDRAVDSRYMIGELTKSTLSFASSLITIFSLIGYLVQIHWLLTAILFLGTIPVLVIDMRFGNRRYKLARSLTALTRKEFYLTHLLSWRHNIKEVRLYQLNDYLLNEWRQVFKQDADSKLKLLIKQNKWNLLARAFLIATYAAAGLFTISLIRSGQIIIGQLVSVMQSLQNVQDRLTSITRMLAQFYENSFYIHDTVQFLHFAEEPQTCERHRSPIERIERIEVNGLTFTYPERDKAA